MESSKRFEELIASYDALKRNELVDLSADQDLSIAIMNLISIEEHLYFTGAKTSNHKYFELIEQVRELRKELLEKILPNTEGEVWCISKHLLAASYRLMEVGNKSLTVKREQAYDFFKKAYDLYILFWGLVMDILPIEAVAEQANALPSYLSNSAEKPNNNFFSKLRELVKKAVNCCIE